MASFSLGEDTTDTGLYKKLTNIGYNDSDELTSLENARIHPKANASSFPLNHIADILF